MADKTGIVNKYIRLKADIGKSAISALYPQDFEYYLCAFELVDGKETVDYFVFPIQPSSIQKNEPSRTNIKSSMSGITVLKNSSVIPQEISLKGNFGRNFKILSMLGVAFEGVGTGIGDVGQTGGGLGLKVPMFSASVKTGYGATKLLQSILKKSNQINTKTGKPYQLYFYNMALGESYLVTTTPSGNMFSQSEDTNMIWQYTILSPLSEVTTFRNEFERSVLLLSNNSIQKNVNTVSKDVVSFLTRNNRVTRIAAL